MIPRYWSGLGAYNTLEEALLSYTRELLKNHEREGIDAPHVLEDRLEEWLNEYCTQHRRCRRSKIIFLTGQTNGHPTFRICHVNEDPNKLIVMMSIVFVPEPSELT